MRRPSRDRTRRGPSPLRNRQAGLGSPRAKPRQQQRVCHPTISLASCPTTSEDIRGRRVPPTPRTQRSASHTRERLSAKDARSYARPSHNHHVFVAIYLSPTNNDRRRGFRYVPYSLKLPNFSGNQTGSRRRASFTKCVKMNRTPTSLRTKRWKSTHATVDML